MSTAKQAQTALTEMRESLQALWHHEIPLSKAMGMHAQSFDGQVLTTAADLQPNINVHGTAFAGSLYAVQALTGWGAVHLQLQLAGLPGSILIASGNIDYSKPVAETIIATCDFGDQSEAMQRLRDTGKTRFELTCCVAANGAEASRFNGTYAVKLKA